MTSHECIIRKSIQDVTKLLHAATVCKLGVALGDDRHGELLPERCNLVVGTIVLKLSTSMFV